MVEDESVAIRDAGNEPKAIWDMTVREALIAAKELQQRIRHEESEVQFAMGRLSRHVSDLDSVVWRLQYEMQRVGMIDKWGDPLTTPTPPHPGSDREGEME